MKKSYILFGLIIAILFVSNVNASNKINKISMDIFIDDYGNANITEMWDATLSSGTEGYHPYYNLGNSSITDFTVTDEDNNLYTFVKNWDINDSFNNKKYRNGFYKTGGELDLCWGISEYGSRIYTLNYTINNFIYNTTDNYQILNWQLIPYDLSSKPKYAYIKVHANKPFSDTLDVWGFGIYGAPTYVADGIIEMVAEDGLDKSEYMTMLVKFPENTFNTTNKINKSFDEVYDTSTENSVEYDNNKINFFAILINMLFSLLPFAFVTYFIVLASRNYTGKKHIQNKNIPSNDVPYFRDLPCKEDIFRAYYIANEYELTKNQADFLGAVILKWIKNGNVEIKEEEKSGLFGSKKLTSLVLIKNDFTDQNEIDLYKMMTEAAKDGVLESKEFERWSSNHYNRLFDWFEDVLKNQNDILINDGLILVAEKKSLGIFTTKVKTSTEKLDMLAEQMAGLKKFYKEFSSLDEKEAIEVKLWQEHLMYAQIFGLAKEVAKEFKKLYPDVISETTLNNVNLVYGYSTGVVHSASAAQSKARSYSSGGGGFSSGGGGGGSFGGGGGGGGFR